MTSPLANFIKTFHLDTARWYLEIVLQATELATGVRVSALKGRHRHLTVAVARCLAIEAFLERYPLFSNRHLAEAFQRSVSWAAWVRTHAPIERKYDKLRKDIRDNINLIIKQNESDFRNQR